MMDKIKKGINELISKENPILPEFMGETITTCSVFSILFNGLKLGEISQNVVYQLTKMNKALGIEFHYDKEGIKEIAEHFVKVIKSRMDGVNKDVQ